MTGIRWKTFEMLPQCCAIVLCVFFVSGCAPAPMAVEGRVKLDGQPLSEAAVQFVPLDGERKKTGGIIEAGRYRLPAADGLLPGRYRVEIIDNPPLSPRGQTAGNRRAFPYQYAHNSPLEIAVPTGQPRTLPLEFDFELTTPPP